MADSMLAAKDDSPMSVKEDRDDSTKRVVVFLEACATVKKRRVDIEMIGVRKRAEKLKIRKVIKNIQEQLLALTQKLMVKELLLDAVEQEIETLQTEWNNSTE